LNQSDINAKLAFLGHVIFQQRSPLTNASCTDGSKAHKNVMLRRFLMALLHDNNGIQKMSA
jgi:hypothetical protein